MTTALESTDRSAAKAGVPEPPPSPGWADRLDAWSARWGDALNPILIKESRQALKSKQFVVTFSLLLVASFGWSVLGSLLRMPGIYFVPSAPWMLMGYYTVLAVPMLMVVPLAAFRSLAAEIDDGTLELLSVSALSPQQVVSGKLASAMLQLMLYFVALVPCVAYAYALRGTDLPTLLVLLALTLLVAIQLTVIGIFMAPMTAGRGSQLTMLVAFLVILVGTEFAYGSFAFALIGEELSELMSRAGTVVICAVAVVATTSGVLLTAAAAQLTPPSENRSTSIRVALFVQQIVWVVMVGYFVLGLVPPFSASNRRVNGDLIALVPLFASGALVVWLAAGSMMASESSNLTPRVRRELPASFLGRMLKTWWMPGPATGVVFAVINAAVVGVLSVQLLEWIEASGRLSRWASTSLPVWRSCCWTALGYLALLLVLVRLLVAWLRRYTETQPAIGLAMLVILSAAMCLIPYGLELHWNDYRDFPYSWWQITNWPWTLQVVVEQTPGFAALPTVVAGAGGTAFLLHLLLLGRPVLPQRLATPQRVQEARRR